MIPARRRPFLHTLLVGAVLLAGALACPGSAGAQIIFDGSLGQAGPLSGPNYVIRANRGQIRGTNLFHSFSEFNILTGERATFRGPAAIQNIVSRVTGGNPSMIDGLLRSRIDGANFFLLNPRGVVFGPNASLDVSGSFHVSTADSVGFADGARFHAALDKPSVLTVAAPSSFGFLSAAPAKITVDGSLLALAPGASLSLVGGDVDVTGAALIAAPGGTISVVSVAPAGEVPFNAATQTPELNPAGFARLGRVEISGGSVLDASGDAGGSIIVRAGRLVLDNNAVVAVETLLDGAQIGVDLRASEEIAITGNTLVATSAVDTGRGGDLVVAAPSVRIDASDVNAFASGTGRAGDVRIDAGRLTVTGGATVGSVSDSVGQGTGGTVAITASDSILISGRGSAGGSTILSTTTDRRDGARLTISSPTVVMEDGGAIQTLSVSVGAGRGGDVVVDAGTLSLTGGAQITSRTGSSGAGGAVTITAAESVSMSGRGSGGGGGPSASGVFSSSCKDCAGTAGAIQIRSGTLALANGAVIQSGNVSDQGGAVSIIASDSIVISGGAAVSSQALRRDVGRVDVSTATLTMDGGVISTSTLGEGRAGDVAVSVGTASLTGGARITSSSDQLAVGAGGDLTLTARESVSISGTSTAGVASGLFSTASSGGTGNAGQITVSAPAVSVSDGGIISVATAGRGQAGNVALSVGTLSLTGGGQIASSSQGAATGRGGDVTVTAANQVIVAGRSGGGTPSGLFSTAAGTGDAGRITISAPSATLDDRGRISVATAGQGNAGGIDVSVGTLLISGGARIDSGTTAAGQGGTATVTASTGITISGRAADGARSGIFSNAEGSGAAGQVVVSTPSLTMVDGTIAAQTFGAGRAGNVLIDVARLTLTGGAQMDSTTFGDGAGGAVKITATEFVLISGSGDGMRSSAQGAGGAGQVTITTPLLTMVDGAVVAAETQGQGAAGNILLEVGSLSMSGGSSVTSNTSAGGRGGTVTVLGGDLVTLTGSSRLSSNTTGASPGGDIDVSGRQIQLSDGSQVTATGTGLGDAGSIRITARDSLVSRDSVVATDSASGTGGNINLLVGSMLHLIGSSVTATVKGGEGRGGNIFIGSPATIFAGAVVSTLGGPGPATAALAPTDFVILERSQIRADAFGGPGGNVQIGARVFLQTESVISASSALGLQGTVDINAQITDVSGSLARLPDAILQASALLRESCAARVGGDRTSTLALAGRDGVPPEPGGSVSGPLGPTTIAGLAGSDGAAAAVRPEIDGTPAYVARPPVLTLRCFK